MIPFDHHRELLRCLSHNQGPVRVIIKKGRDCGVTTYVKDRKMIDSELSLNQIEQRVERLISKCQKANFNCPIHGAQYDYDDGGTGCICGSMERPPNAVTTSHYVEIETPPIVKNPKPFCTKCGRSHKAQWCK